MFFLIKGSNCLGWVFYSSSAAGDLFFFFQNVAKAIGMEDPVVCQSMYIFKVSKFHLIGYICIGGWCLSRNFMWVFRNFRSLFFIELDKEFLYFFLYHINLFSSCNDRLCKIRLKLKLKLSRWNVGNVEYIL